MSKWITFSLLAAALPSALLARSAGSPIFSAGVPTAIDGNGQTCTRCHRLPAVSLNEAPGYLRVQAFHYRPGQTQTVKVTVSHPEAARWGFQLTARRASDLTQRAGNFVMSPILRIQCSDDPSGRDVTLAQPCPSNAHEFISHIPVSTTLGSNGTSTWDVEWKAPDTDVGDVVFFAAGNAANANRNNQGDHIYSNGPDGFRIEAEGRVCPNTVRPTLQAARNAASGTMMVAMNTLLSIFGSDFVPQGTKREAGAADFRTNAYPTELACIAVEVGGQKIPLTYVQPDQINAQLPAGIGAGTVPYRVLVNPGRGNQLVSDIGMLTVTNTAPAFFTYPGSGNIKAIHNSDGAYVGTAAGTRAVKPGDVIQLYATGLGVTEPVWQAGEFPDRASAVKDRVTVTIGGTALAAGDVLYAGVAPGLISGLYQINVHVPATVADGDVPVTVSVGGVTSAAGTTIPVRR